MSFLLQGGGLYLNRYGSMLTLSSVTFSDNRASEGEALHAATGPAQGSVLTNVTFQGHRIDTHDTVVASANLPWQCPLGTWMPPAGRIRADFVGCAFDCAIGHYGNHIDDLTTFACSGKCPVGNECDARTAHPRPCRPGWYANRRGMSSCLQCGVGNYSSSSGAAECTPCPPGTFSRQPGASRCELCPSGGFCAQVGAASTSMTFEACPAGSWSAAVGATSSAACVPCEPGSASTVRAANDASICQLCLPGSFAAVSHEVTCTRCPSGKFQRGTGAARCESCPAGSYCPHGTSNPLGCESGAGVQNAVTRYRESRSAADCVCKAGYYDNGNASMHSTCEECPSGTDCSAASGSTIATLRACLKASHCCCCWRC